MAQTRCTRHAHSFPGPTRPHPTSVHALTRRRRRRSRPLRDRRYRGSTAAALRQMPSARASRARCAAGLIHQPMVRGIGPRSEEAGWSPMERDCGQMERWIRGSGVWIEWAVMCWVRNGDAGAGGGGLGCYEYLLKGDARAPRLSHWIRTLQRMWRRGWGGREARSERCLIGSQYEYIHGGAAPKWISQRAIYMEEKSPAWSGNAPISI